MLKSIIAVVSGGLILLTGACANSVTATAKTASERTPAPQVQVPAFSATPFPTAPPTPEQPVETPANCSLVPMQEDTSPYHLAYAIETTPAEPESKFVFSHLQIFPELSVVDENVTISVVMMNPGDKPGQYKVDLQYGGNVIQTQNVTLDANEAKQVDFNMWAVYGEHDVTAGQLAAPTIMRVVY